MDEIFLVRKKETMSKQCRRPMNDWLHDFFTFALKKKKNFYWSWNDFMITVRKQKKNQQFLILEIFLKNPPFLVQKHIDITGINHDTLVASLLYLHHLYDDSPLIRRNHEHSSQFLSFRSFVQMNEDQKPLETTIQRNVNRLLVLYLMKTLETYGIFPRSTPQTRRWSLSQLLVDKKKSVKA